MSALQSAAEPLLSGGDVEDTSAETTTINVLNGAAAAGVEPTVADDELAAVFRLLSLVCVLLLGFGCARVAGLAGAPDDAVPQAVDGAALSQDLGVLVVLGCALASLNRLTEKGRFRWLCASPRFILLYLGTCSCFGALDRVPGLRVSLSLDSIRTWGALAWVVFTAAFALIFAVVGWHVVYALALPTRARHAFLLSRGALNLACLVAWTIMRFSPEGRMGWEATHLHHWALGFLLASWGRFDAVISTCLLCVGAGLMTQGIAAYHYVWVFYTTGAGSEAAAKAAGCIRVLTNDTSVICTWLRPTGAAEHGWGLQSCPFGRGPHAQGVCQPL